MREHRKLLVAAIAVVAGYFAGAGLRQLTPGPAMGSPRPPAATPTIEREPSRPGAALEAPRASSAGDAAPAARALAGGAAEGVRPLTFPDLGAGTPAIRAGIGSLLTGRPVRPGERLPASPFDAWLRPAQSLGTSAGVEVVLWAAGSHEAPPSAKGGTPVSRIPAAKIANPIRSWFLSTSAAPDRTSVLPLYDSSTFFARTDLTCTDTTTVSTLREVRAQPATLWIELDEIWRCERRRGTASRPAGTPAAPDDGLFGVDRRVGFVVVVERDGTLRRLSAGVPVLQRRDDGATGELEASFTEDGLFTLGAGSTAPSEEQEAWVGAYELDPLLRQAIAAPTWIDEPLPGGPVAASCAPLRDAPRLEIEAQAPVTRRSWAANPEVTVLAVPADVSRVQLRALATEAGGSRVDVTDDPCLRLQLVGAGLRPMPTRSLYEVVGGPERIESATLLALYRGQRLILRFEEAPPLPPALPPAAAAQLAGSLPGLRLPGAEGAAGGELVGAGSGLVVADLDFDGREDVAAVLLDRERWELAVLTQTARGGYRLAFHAGAPRVKPGPGEPVEELSLRRTAAGDLSLRRARGDGGEEWIVHHVGQAFSRTVLPLLRPEALAADELGLAPHGRRVDPRAAGREALLGALQAGDAETFAGLGAMDPAQRVTTAGWIAGALGEARGDRSRLLVALALLGRPAAEAATPALGALLFGGQPFRSDLEPRAAELALARMGEPALQLLVLHPDAPGAERAAAEIIREEPDLRDLYRDALRRRPERLATGLAWAPIASPDELVEALRLLPSGRRSVVHRLRGLARAPRTPETTALLTAALPVLLEELSSAGDPAEVAEVAQLVGGLGSIAEPAVPSLQGALWSHDCRIRVAARAALAALSGGDHGVAGAARDLAVECPDALPARLRPPRPPPAPQLPAEALVVRLLDRVDGRGYGFVAPVDLDWRGLARASLPGLDAELGQGPLLEQVRRRAAGDEYEDHCLPFHAPLPAPLRRAHYYGVTAAGVAPLEPRKVLGDVCVGAYGVARYRGRVEATSSESGFVLVSGAALTVSEQGRDALGPLWPAIAAACAIDPSSQPRGIAFRLGQAGKSTQYAYALLPPGDLCTERRRLLRIEGQTAEVVEASDSGCAM